MLDAQAWHCIRNGVSGRRYIFGGWKISGLEIGACRGGGRMRASGYRRRRSCEDAGFVAFRVLPTVLDPYIAFFQRPIQSPLADERFGFKFSLAGNLLRPLGQYVIKPLLQPAALDALPLFIVLAA